MTCSAVRDALPLLVGGDLGAAESAPLREHLAACPACRAEEAAFRASQAFWKDAPGPELDEAFHADVRRGVRLRLAAEREARAARGRGWWLRALPVAAVAVLGIALALLTRLVPPPPGAVSVVRPPVRATAPAVRSEAPAPAANAEAPRVEPRPAATRAAAVARRTRRPRVPGREPAATFARVTRIEMTTNNPNVRIIWLAHAGDAAPI